MLDQLCLTLVFLALVWDVFSLILNLRFIRRARGCSPIPLIPLLAYWFAGRRALEALGFYPTVAPALLIFAALVVFHFACQVGIPAIYQRYHERGSLEDPNYDRSKTKELQRLESTVPVFPSMTLVRRAKDSKGTFAAIYRDLRSDAKYEDVQDYYLTELGGSGWLLSSRGTSNDRGVEQLIFERMAEPEYYVRISYNPDTLSDDKSNYGITLGWKARPPK